LTQGAGFLNAAGAVELSRAFSNRTDAAFESAHASWSRHVIWGNQLLTSEVLARDASEWAAAVTWGAASQTFNGGEPRNVVWGNQCGGDDCPGPWTITAAHDASVVWGTVVDKSIVWGAMTPTQSVVWGAAAINSRR
jgi:hypothetical protein